MPRHATSTRDHPDKWDNVNFVDGDEGEWAESHNGVMLVERRGQLRVAFREEESEFAWDVEDYGELERFLMMALNFVIEKKATRG